MDGIFSRPHNWKISRILRMDLLIYACTCIISSQIVKFKVSDFLQERIMALRDLHPTKYDNICCIRTNAMKYLPNYFTKGQLRAMFFLYPDPHFKKTKHKWRIISPNLLSEYAFFLRPNGFMVLCYPNM